MNHVADRLALLLLAENDGKGSFDVQIPDPEQVTKVRDALERLGCVVEVEPDGLNLHVNCPE
jgi:hypothetical protein